MKKILQYLTLLLLFNFIALQVVAASLIKSNEFVINKHLKTSLSSGDWYLVAKTRDSYYGLILNYYDLIRIENNRVVEWIGIGKYALAGVYESIINNAIQEIYFTNKYDGCYEKPEYYLLERYKRGTAFNCMRVRHIDVLQALNHPDDPEDRGNYAKEKKWVKDNNYKWPRVMLVSNHMYFSRGVRGELVGIDYAIDPEILYGIESQYISEDSSEYHKNNIEQFPKHKKIMENFVSKAAKRHKVFEQNHGAKKKHLLNLDKYILSDLTTEKNSNLTENLKKLNELYKSGVLTKEEFEKAKKKILN